MTSDFEPPNPVEGGRVYTPLTVADLETRANVGPSGYTVANIVRQVVENALTSAARSTLAANKVDAVGFEFEVDGKAGNAAPFGGVQGAIGISLIWFTEPDQATPDPYIYLFTRYGTDGVEPIGDSPNPSAVFEGCVFAAHFAGEPPVTPDDWLRTMETAGVAAGDGGGGLLSGEVTLYPGGNPGFAGDADENWYAFVSEFDIRPDGRLEGIHRSRFLHTGWLLSQLGVIRTPASGSWDPPAHPFWLSGTASPGDTTRPAYVPAWTAESASERVRNRIVLSALVEETHWTNADGTRKNEGEPSFGRDKLETYYEDTIDHARSLAISPVVDPATHAKKASEDAAGFYWSAVFISYAVSQAGVPTSGGFAFSIRHITYIAQAYVNRMNEDRTKPFWLYKPDEIDPVQGDILCKNRSADDQWTFDEIEDQFVTKTETDGETTYAITAGVKPSGPSHTDIVVSTETTDGTAFIETVGGNTYDYETGSYDTVGRKRWKLKGGDWVMVDENDGELSDPPWDADEDDVFGFIRRVESTSTH